jgi:asparagine synthase (glutamine-hydrolysing)
MCGIAGLARVHPDARALDEGELRRISAALAKRGPDGSGEWSSAEGNVALAHRRLAIIDLSPNGAQPMRSANGRYVISFNGEIYDYREQRAELLRDGFEFRTESDTELLMELFAREGSRAFSRVRGMYAAALWDDVQQELILARDPYGIKPLYYAVVDGILRFASQVKALEASGAVSLEVDRDAVAGFLAWGSVPEPLTIRRAIRALPAGHVLRASIRSGLRIDRLPADVRNGTTAAPHTAVGDSVRAHLVADTPVSVFLSAGMDSAVIAALARRELREPPTALTLSVAEHRGTERDEVPLAREVAGILGLRHVVREIDGAEVRSLLSDVIAAMDQPSIDGFNTFLIARLAKEEGFKVALSGLGGDELLGGYASFADVPRWQRRARLLARVPGLGSTWPPLARRFAPERPKLEGFLRLGESLAGAYVLRRGLFLPNEIRNGFPSECVGNYDPVLDSWEQLDSSPLGPSHGIVSDPWRAVHRMESSIYLKNQLLRDADWAGMAHGVEIRVPFVDFRLRAALECANFAPARTGGKVALARSLAPELPERLFLRRKSGFQLPIADWLDPSRATHSRGVGGQSRRLALLILDAFSISVSRAAR